jgi:molybdopterin molybdotransferase
VISVTEARERIASAFKTVAGERVPIADAGARVLAEDVKALLGQPPEPVSSMDGYALRAADAKAPGVKAKRCASSPVASCRMAQMQS